MCVGDRDTHCSSGVVVLYYARTKSSIVLKLAKIPDKLMTRVNLCVGFGPEGDKARLGVFHKKPGLAN